MNPSVIDWKSLTNAYPGVAWTAVLVAAVAGALWGIFSAYLGVVVEKHEKLEAEELEERAEYEKGVDEKLREAEEKGEEPPQALPWHSERYGFTWLEKYFSPLLGAFLFAAFIYRQGVTQAAFIHLIWIAIFIHVVTFDLKHRLIMNVVTYPSVVLGIAIAHWSPGLTIFNSILGAVVIGFLFVFQYVVSRGSIGLGDAKLGAVIGACCGLSFDFSQPDLHLGALYAMLYGVIFGGVIAVLLLITRVRGLKDPIPYGPYLCAGAVLILYIGP